jgi:hypothetical protein
MTRVLNKALAAVECDAAVLQFGEGKEGCECFWSFFDFVCFAYWQILLMHTVS